MKKTLLLVVLVSLLTRVTVTQSEKVSLRTLTAEKKTIEEEEHQENDYYRLSKEVTPQTYELRMIPFLEGGNLTFIGDVTIKLMIHSATKTILLHSLGLNITGLKLFMLGPPTVEMPLRSFYYDKYRRFLVVESIILLRRNEIYALYVDFNGKLNEKNIGFYRSSYTDKKGKTKWLAATQFQPQAARMAFPCFDEPQLKANFSISIARLKGMNTFSNMKVKGPPMTDPNLPENYVWDHFQETPKMSTYLVAFVVSDFMYLKAKDQEFRVWAREEYIHDAEYGLEIGPKLLDVMTNFTLTEYSLPKLDMAAIPDFNMQAMENYGLVTFRESALLFNDKMSSSANKQCTATVVAHELAHQWFGNLVSPEWWKWLWLNEGFATYFAKAAVERIEPSWRVMEQFVVEELQPALLSDSKETHPMNINIRKSADINKVFDCISYKKAGSVIKMMANFLSDYTFTHGLRKYILRRQYDSATDDDLFEAMDDQAIIDQVFPDNISVSEIMKSWTDQAGYPVITVKRDFLSRNLAVKQERFMLEPSSNSDKSGIWWIPITYTSMKMKNFNETKPMYWMKERMASIQLESVPDEDEWIIFNLQQSGFYRVNYDEQNWRLLSDYLRSKNYRNIPPVHRAQLIDDALNLARGGHLNYSIALTLTSYLEHESDYIPLYSAYQAFSFLETRMSTSNELYYFKVHIRHLMKTYYKILRFEESSQVEDHVTKLSRHMLWPWICKYHYDCITRASKLFKNWKENQTNSIPADLRSLVYCIGVREGGNEDWNYLWEAYQTSSIATDKELILKSLGCSKNKTIIYRYLEMTINTESGIRKHDFVTLFTSVFNSPEGLETAVTFLINNSEVTLRMFGEDRVGKIFNHAVNYISSKEQADQMKALLMKINSRPFKPVAQIAIETISKNLAWFENYGPDIESWLKNKYNGH